MNFFYILLFIGLTWQTSAQINLDALYGDWTLMEVKMADGSKELSGLHRRDFNTQKRWLIKKNEYSEIINPILNRPYIHYKFELEGNNMIFNSDFFYEIVRLSYDELSIIVRMSLKKDLDKSKQLWFKRSSLISAEKALINKDSTEIIANKFYTPKLKKVYKRFNSGRFLTNKNDYIRDWGNYYFNCKINIFPSQKKILVEVLNLEDSKDKNNSKYFKEHKKEIESNFDFWDLSSFEQYEKITIPLVIESINNGRDAESNYVFFTNNIYQVINSQKPVLYDKKNYQHNFDLAYNYFQKNEFSNAIKYFRAAYEAYPLEVDPLYNIVNIYFHLNEINAACETLKTLVDLEQTEGIKLYNAHCLKN